jgi:DnaJ-domain-containing protein 1
MRAMAPRFSRRRDRAEDPDDGDDDGTTDLGADEHAWWAQREVATPWAPREAPTADEARPDVLAEHFGADWRTSFGFPLDDAPPPDSAPADEPEDEIDTSDPYAVLRVDPSATWEEIVDAHRRMARRHHPDRLFGQSEAEVAAAEEQIRLINIAYQELRVRRAR